MEVEKTIFIASAWNTKISEVTSHRTTDASYFTMKNGKEVCNRKDTSYNKAFESKEAAKEYLISIRNEKIKSAKYQIEKAESEIKEIDLL